MADQDIKVVGLSSSKDKGKINWKILSAVIGIVVLSLGIIAGILLVRQQQNIREKAAVPKCPEAQQCPMIRNQKHLLNCNPPEADNSPSDSICNIAGRVEVCGQDNFCCPVAGGNWTKDMSKCQGLTSPTPTSSGTISCSSNFSDTFDSVVDTNNWSKFGDTTISAGQLVLNVPAGQSTGSRITHKSLLTGDFAITFDISSLSKTGTGAVEGTLVLSTSDQSKIITIGRNIKQDVHNVSANFVPGNKNKTVSINSTDSVNFKVERKTGKVTVWYKISPSATYIELIAFTDLINGDLAISLVALSVTGSPTPATIAKFDNFILTCVGSASSTATATATATSTSGSKTATPTATATSTSLATKTATAKPTPTSSSAPIPVTGANLPTIIGAGFGVVMLFVSLVLAL